MSPDQANGHCVPVMKYTSATGDKGGFVSWAALMEMDRDFYENVSDEAFIVVSDGWIKADGESPSGFNITQLLADQALVIA